MAGYQALAAVGRSIVEILNAGYAAELPDARAAPDRRAGRHRRLRPGQQQPVRRHPLPRRLGLLLPAHASTARPGPAGRPSAAGDGIPRIPLRMHMMLSAWDQRRRERAGVARPHGAHPRGRQHPHRAAAGPDRRLGPRRHRPGRARRPRAGLDERGVPGAHHRLPPLPALRGPRDRHRRRGRPPARAGDDRGQPRRR